MNTLATDLSHFLDPHRVLTAPTIVERLSRDFYWYSPILRRQLEDKRGEVVVQPVNSDEILNILHYARQNSIAVTARGAGTGNYGQCIPLAGGIILDLSLMDKLESITPDGVAICQPGLRLGTLETEARKQGWELRCYPSTLLKASIGGFLGGGSGGIGSVAHGGLRDFNTVRAFEVATLEEPPRIVLHQNEAIHEILHSWGTNGIFTRIWLALAPRIDWTQCLISFGTYEEAYTFAESVANSSTWTKRLITVFEWPIPSFFTPIRARIEEGKAMVLIMISSSQMEALRTASETAGGTLTFAGVYEGPRTQPLLSDYTWNHTTLWAMKSDAQWTYLQCSFSPTDARNQFRLLRERFGTEILFHVEFMKNGEGVIIPGAIPLVYFTTEERLNEMIDYCREIGVFVANPHVNHVNGGGRFRADNVQLAAKRRYDPQGLFNPGKMLSFEQEEATGQGAIKS